MKPLSKEETEALLSRVAAAHISGDPTEDWVKRLVEERDYFGSEKIRLTQVVIKIAQVVLEAVGVHHYPTQTGEQR